MSNVRIQIYTDLAARMGKGNRSGSADCVATPLAAVTCNFAIFLECVRGNSRGNHADRGCLIRSYLYSAPRLMIVWLGTEHCAVKSPSPWPGQLTSPPGLRGGPWQGPPQNQIFKEQIIRVIIHINGFMSRGRRDFSRGTAHGGPDRRKWFCGMRFRHFLNTPWAFILHPSSHPSLSPCLPSQWDCAIMAA